jgi:hypothetical protein
MTDRQLAQRFLEVKARILPVFKDFNVPVRAGASGGGLKNSFKFIATDKGFEIVTDMYYMPYTNEVWISPRWRGRKNPNEKWFELGHEYLAQYMATQLGGRYVRTQ